MNGRRIIYHHGWSPNASGRELLTIRIQNEGTTSELGELGT
jgi:hypothetical protein